MDGLITVWGQVIQEALAFISFISEQLPAFLDTTLRIVTSLAAGLIQALLAFTEAATGLLLIADTFSTNHMEARLAQCAIRLDRAREAFTALVAYQNARDALTNEDYEAQSAQLESDYDQALADYHQVEADFTDLRERAAKYCHCTQTLRQFKGQSTTEFMPVLWRTLIDHATIDHGGTLYDGQTINMPIATKKTSQQAATTHRPVI
ncbi:MAG: hypothetical protein Q3976_09030 [Corynebacterium sp.]|nr:hypothetical protein [Corynebacterium sp.]